MSNRFDPKDHFHSPHVTEEIVMSTIQPQGEKLRNAVKYISEIRKENPDVNLMQLVDETSLKFDLSPKDSEFLTRFVKEDNQ